MSGNSKAPLFSNMNNTMSELNNSFNGWTPRTFPSVDSRYLTNAHNHPSWKQTATSVVSDNASTGSDKATAQVETPLGQDSLARLSPVRSTSDSAASQKTDGQGSTENYRPATAVSLNSEDDEDDEDDEVEYNNKEGKITVGGSPHTEETGSLATSTGASNDHSIQPGIDSHKTNETTDGHNETADEHGNVTSDKNNVGSFVGVGPTNNKNSLNGNDGSFTFA